MIEFALRSNLNGGDVDILAVGSYDEVISELENRVRALYPNGRPATDKYRAVEQSELVKSVRKYERFNVPENGRVFWINLLDPVAAAAEIEAVSVEQVVSRAGKVSYQYWAKVGGNVKAVKLRLATRQYDSAFFYGFGVASGAYALSAYFSYGKNPASYGKDQLIKSWSVDEIQ